MPRPDPKAVFYLRLVLATALFFGPGTWAIVTRRAAFTIGGDENKTSAQDKHAINVDAEGLPAIRIGLAAYALGLFVVCEAIPGRRRIPIFLLAAVLLLGCGGWWIFDQFATALAGS